MTRVKFAKQVNGIGQYAECVVEARNTDAQASFVTDACSWEDLKSQYHNTFIAPIHLEWKQSVIIGIEAALKRLPAQLKKEFVLMDVLGYVSHSSVQSMFAVGYLSVFEELKLDPPAQD